MPKLIRSDRIQDGVDNQDAAALATLYTEDARYLAPNMPPYEGRAAIREALQQQMEGAHNLLVEPIDVREAGDLTIEYGRYTWDVEPTGAERMTEVGKYVVIHEARRTGRPDRARYLRPGRTSLFAEYHCTGPATCSRPVITVSKLRVRSLSQPHTAVPIAVATPSVASARPASRNETPRSASTETEWKTLVSLRSKRRASHSGAGQGRTWQPEEVTSAWASVSLEGQ